MRKTLILLAAIMSFIIVSAASAQEGWRSYVPKGYIGVLAGYSFPNDLELNNGPSYGLDSTWVAGAKVGGFFAKWLALEIEYYHIGDMDVDSPLRGNIRADNLFLNVVLRYPEGRIHPFVGAGLGWSWLKWNDIFNVPGLGDVSSDDDTWAAQGLIGLDFDIATNTTLAVTYRYFYTEPGFADKDWELSSHLFTVGVNFMF